MRPLATLVLALLLAGCGVSDDEAEVREVTERFYAAIREHDGDAACELLSAETAKALEMRRRGSLQSKPVGAPHEATAEEG